MASNMRLEEELEAQMAKDEMDEALKVGAGDTAKCTDGWHGSKRCRNPKHSMTQSGASYMRWRCNTCGATGEETWD